MSESEACRVITKSAMQQNLQKPVEIVVHATRRKNNGITHISQNQGEISKQSKTTGKNINIKNAKFEIMKFAMSSYKFREREDAKVTLAIKLGAVPPKNKYVNYKKLKEDKMKEKDETEHFSKMQMVGKTFQTTAWKKSVTERRRADKGILGQYGKVSKGKSRKSADFIKKGRR